MRLTQGMRDAFIRQVMDDVPSVDYKDEIRKIALAEAVARLPAKVRAVWEDLDLRGYIALHSSLICGRYLSLPAASDEELELSASAQQAVSQLSKLKDAQQAQHSQLEQTLRSVTLSVTTTQSLLTALPEFEKYIPKDPAAALRTLPVLANVVTDFMRAGWPKDKLPKGTKKPAKRAADRAAA